MSESQVSDSGPLLSSSASVDSSADTDSSNTKDIPSHTRIRSRSSLSKVRFDDNGTGSLSEDLDGSPSSAPSPSSNSASAYGSTVDDTTPLFWTIHTAKKGGRRWLRRTKRAALTNLSDGSDKAAANPISEAINLAHTTNNGVKYQPLELAAGQTKRKREHHTRIGAKLSQLFHPHDIHTIMGQDEKKDPTSAAGAGYHSVYINPDADEMTHNTSNPTSVASSSNTSPSSRYSHLSRLSSGFNTPSSSFPSSPSSSSQSSSYLSSSSWPCMRWLYIHFHANKQHIMEQLTDPAGEYRRVWLLIIFLFLLYNAISVPLRLAFSDIWLDIHTVIALSFFDYLGDICFLLDVGLYFYTPYINQGMLERDTKEIQSHYLKGWFLSDLISSFPIDLLFIHNGLRAVLPWRLTRLLRFAKYDQYFQVWEQYSTRYPQFIRFFKLLLSILLILHWLACLWFWCGYYYGFGATIWLPADGIQQASLSSQYIFAFWWATNIVTQVGGDPGLPTNDVERALDLSIAFLSVFVVAVVIGNVNELVSELNADEGRLREKLQTLNHFMVTRRLPDELQARIRSYYLKIWIRRGGVDDAAIMEELPTSLRTEISLVMNKDILGKVAIFANSSTGFIHSLVGHLKLQTYGPGEMIVKEGDIGSEMYFVSRGQVSVIKGAKQVGTITAGGVFGEIAVLQESSQRTASIQAVNYCDLFVLTHEDMMTLFKSFPAEKQIILNVAETRKAKDLLTKVLNDEKLLKRDREAGFSKDPQLVAQLIDLFKPIALGAGALHNDHEHYQEDKDNANVDENKMHNRATNTLLRESGLIEGENGELIDLEELENRGLVFGPFQPADTLYFIGKGAVDILPNLDQTTSPLIRESSNSNVESLLEEDQRIICTLKEGSFFGCITDEDYQVSAVISKEHRCDTIIFAFNASDFPALQNYYESIDNPKDKQRVRRSLTALFTRYRTEGDYKNSITPLATPSSKKDSARSTPTQKSLHQLIRTVSKTARMSRRNSLSFGNGEMLPLQLAAGGTATAAHITEDSTTKKIKTTTTAVQEEKKERSKDTESFESPSKTATFRVSPTAATTRRTATIAATSSPTVITISEATETSQHKETTTAADSKASDTSTTATTSQPPTPTTTIAASDAGTYPVQTIPAPIVGSPNYYAALEASPSQERLLAPAFGTVEKDVNVNISHGRPRSLTHLSTEADDSTILGSLSSDRARKQRRSNSVSVSPKAADQHHRSHIDNLSPEPLSATRSEGVITTPSRDRRPSYINIPQSRQSSGAAPFAFLLKLNQSNASQSTTAATSPRAPSSPLPNTGHMSPQIIADQDLHSPHTPSTQSRTSLATPLSPALHGHSGAVVYPRGSVMTSTGPISTASAPSARMLFLEKALNDLSNDQLLLLCNKATLKLYSRLHSTPTVSTVSA